MVADETACHGPRQLSSLPNLVMPSGWLGRGRTLVSLWDESVGEACSVESQTAQNNANELSLLHRGMALYGEALEIAPPRPADDAARLQMGFISQSFNSLFASIQLSKQGLYFQSLGTMRFIFESWVTVRYLEVTPKDAAKWSNRNGAPGPPKVDTMLKAIDHGSKEAKKNVGAHRSTLSRFVHSDPFAVNYLFEDGAGGPEVRWGMKYDQQSFAVSCFEIALWLGLMLTAIGSFLPDESDWHGAYKDVASELLYLVDGIREKNG